MPDIDLIRELGRGYCKCFRRNGDYLQAIFIGKQYERNRKERDEERIVARIRINTVSIVQPLDGTGNVNMEVVIRSIGLSTNALEIAENVFMDVQGEWSRGKCLIRDGGVEGKGLGNYFHNLFEESSIEFSCIHR